MASESYHKGRINVADEKQHIYEQTVSALQSEERFKKYFSNYSDDTVQSFISHYAKMKAQWHANSETMLNLRKHHETQWVKNAFMILQHIQLKKLFNLECEWRAEKINCEGIEITWDFYLWSTTVLDCPHIQPVNEDELSLYISFLGELSDKKSFNDHFILNSYHNLKDGFFKKGKHYDEYPAWFIYYDEHYGTDLLLTLSDIRGEKENKYTHLWREEMKPKWEAMNAGLDKRPPIRSLYEKDFTKWFLKEFETKEILSLYHHTLEWDEKHARIEEIEMDLINLGEADREVPVEDDDDWRKGVKRAAEKYYRERTIEALPDVWKKYRERIADGKPAMEEGEGRAANKSGNEKIRNDFMNHILRGRELSGEPRDLNF